MILNILTINIMKKLLLLALTLCLAVPATAQQGRPSDDERQKLETARIAFLTNRLHLDVEQAKLFWPIFNEYEKKKSDLVKEYNAKRRELAGPDGYRNMSEENARKMLDIYLDQKQGELDLEKKYLKEFAKVLNQHQVWSVIRFDSDFRRSLMKRIGEEGKDKDGKGGKPGNCP